MQYGFSRKEFLRMSILDIRPPEEVPKLLNAALFPHEYDPKGDLWTHRKKNGQLFVAEVTGFRLTFEGRPAELILARDTTRDISERP